MNHLTYFKPYFLIMMLTWAAALIVMVTLWIMVAAGVDLGDLSILIPSLSVIAGLVVVTKTPWFAANIREPVQGMLGSSSSLDVLIHVQVFTMVCGVMGTGGAIVAAGFLYPPVDQATLETLQLTEEYLANFKSRTSVALVGGLSSCAIMYLYMFADVRNSGWLKWAALGLGCLLFFYLAHVL